jgi:hypothetical protein
MSKKFDFGSDEEEEEKNEFNENNKRLVQENVSKTNKKQKNENINLFILYNGKTVEIKNIKDEKISVLKIFLHLDNDINLHYNLFELYFKGEKLKEERLISEYNISHEDKLELIENEKVPCGKNI